MLTQNTCSAGFDQTSSMIWKLELATDIQTEIITFDKTTFCVQWTPKWKTPTKTQNGLCLRSLNVLSLYLTLYSEITYMYIAERKTAVKRKGAEESTLLSGSRMVIV